MCISRLITISLAVLILSASIAAQSGRVVETPAPTPSPTPRVEEAKPPPCETGLDETIYLYQRPVDDFVKESNRLGRCGYRLELAGRMAGLSVFGALKKDPENNIYEYRWFAAGRSGEVLTRANAAAKEGFYFRRSMMFTSAGSAPQPDNDSVFGKVMFPGNGSLFIFERKNGVIKRREYRMVEANIPGKKHLVMSQNDLNDKVAQGFRPVALYYQGMFVAHEILLEKDPDIEPEGDYLLLRYSMNVAKTLTRLAAQGYRPLTIGIYFAVLHRKNSDSLNLRYESTDHFNTAAKKLAPLEGARYEMNGINIYLIDYDMVESKPFYSFPLTPSSRRYRYEFVDLTNFNERYFTNKDKKASFLDVPAPNLLARFREKLRDGYSLRDIVVNMNEITAVFEKEFR